jgi:hypothetical protein
MALIPTDIDGNWLRRSRMILGAVWAIVSDNSVLLHSGHYDETKVRKHAGRGLQAHD